MQRWVEMEQYLLAEAERDLLDGQAPRPCLTAFAGEAPLLLAFLRPFPDGGCHDPIIELVSLAAPLGANRLKLSIGGRAPSMHDPGLPADGRCGGLRQRVLHIETADGSRGRVRSSSAVYPYDLAGGAVRWGQPSRLADAAGWIPYALGKTVRMRAAFRGVRIEDVRRQAERCARLGHTLALSPDAAERIGISPQDAAEAPRPGRGNQC